MPQLAPILHETLPLKVWMDPRLARLPGIVPMVPGDWVLRDAAYGAQMAERERLIAAHPERVHALLPQARAAAEELQALIAARLPDEGFTLSGGVWTCPDGRQVTNDRANPLLTLGRLVQPDLCLLQPGPEGEHVLTGAILCFPARWTLAEKIGRPLLRIHRPVPAYDATMARRVQRLFDAIRADQPLMRGNALAHDDPSLFVPKPEGEVLPPRPPGSGAYVRIERQCLIRLRASGAVLFSIQTCVASRASLTPDEEAAFVAWKQAEAADHSNIA
jgi:dimethylamine monooxygenase subunit A